MNRDATLDRFEATLREALVDQRPIEGAPGTLHARIDAIPERVGAVGWRARVAAMAAARGELAALVGVLVIIAVAASARSIIAPVTGGGTGPTTVPLDPTIEGPGILHNPIPTLLIAQGLAVLLAAGLARRWRSIGGFESYRDMGRGLVLILLVLASALALQPGIANLGGSEGTALGYGIPVYPPPGADGPDVYYESAKPGGPMIAFFDVTNVSALPVTLEGLVSNEPPGSGGPRWTALAVATSRDVFPNDLSQLRPFSPQVIQPNQLFTIYLVGKAGTCAFGPGYTVDTVGVGGFASMSRSIQLSYSMLGLSTRTTIEMPMQLVEPTNANCP